PAVHLSPPSLPTRRSSDLTTSAAQAVTLTNTGSATLTITSITASGDFSQTNTCGSPVIIGGTCTITVTFTPTVAGSRTGTLSVTDNASGSPHTAALSGKGTTSAAVSPSP